MKLLLCFMMLSILNVSGSIFSQNYTLDISVRDKTVKEVFKNIESQSQFRFLYNDDFVGLNRVVSLNTANKDIDEILHELLADANLTYRGLENNLIVITPVKETVQERVIRGTVTDVAGNPLPGVSVLLEGTTIGTVTNVDGQYSLSNVPPYATLEFSFVGMITQKRVIDDELVVNIILREDVLGLEEVVVIGYGTIRRTELTSAVSSVSSEDFVRGAVADPGQLIRGRVPGLTIVNPDANPTSLSQIVMRGVTTLASGTQPLIIIDGIPGSLKSVAPEDIESIDILKDGAAAAIYGTRGTNGVILITTRGVPRDMAPTVEWNSYLTTQVIARELDMMNPTQYRQLVAQGKPGAFDYGSSTNWGDQIFQTPVSHTHNLSFRGGSATTNYLLNVNYKALQGLMIKSDNNVATLRIAANHTMLDGKVIINGNLAGYQQSFFSIGPGYSWRGQVYRNSLTYNPTDPVFDEDGRYTEHPDVNNYHNPLALIMEADGQVNETNFRPYGTVTFLPAEGLSIKFLGSYNVTNFTAGYSESFDHIFSRLGDRMGWADRRATRSVNDLIEITANYSTQLNNHGIGLLGGYSSQSNMWEHFSMNNQDFPSDQFSYNNMGSGIALSQGRGGQHSSKNTSKLASYFVRGNYNYDERYLLMASVRYEGSTRFGADHKWGVFPAVSAGWNIINEAFMQNLPNISALKIRGGYGVTGTEPSASYQSLARLTYGARAFVGGNWVPTIFPSSNANPDLRWERKEEINIGFELGLFNNRIFGSVDLYQRTTHDLLWNYNVAFPPFLYPTVFANAGNMENQGIELEITAIPVQTADFYWNTSVNYSTNRNELTRLSGERFSLEAGFFYAGHTGEPIQEPTHRVEEGHTIGNFWGFRSVDIDDNGYWIIEGEDGNPKPIIEQQPEDKHVLGNGLPNHYLNWNNTFNYRKFDLTVSMRGAFDFQILNYARMFYGVPVGLTRGNIFANTYDDIYDKRPLSDFQEQQYVSYFVEDGDYWKIDNITLGWSTDLQRGPINSVRLYGSLSNVLTITGYSGLDPEVTSVGLNPGIDHRDRYPTTRTFTFGILMNL